MHKRLLQAILVASLATVASSAAIAQSPADGPATTVDTRDDDRGFDWGLLGLLGLLGLIPRKRRDVHNDTRTANTVR
jgi:hypothetical protein